MEFTGAACIPIGYIQNCSCKQLPHYFDFDVQLVGTETSPAATPMNGSVALFRVGSERFDPISLETPKSKVCL